MSIQLHSFVWFQSERIGKHVGYIEDTYENLQGKKVVTMRYFLFAEDIERHALRLCPQPREIFATSSLREVDAESIGGAAEVLTLEDFARCHRRHPYIPRNLASNAFVCYREYKDGAVRPFRLSDLEGYSTQGILSSLHRHETVAIAMEAEDCSDSESTSTVDES